MIKVTHIFKAHAGGTKFYETVLFERADGGASVLVKRYGSMDKKKQGGQVKIEDYATAIEARSARDSIWRQKDKPKEYSVSALMENGIERRIAISGKGQLDIVSRTFLMEVVAEHYGKGGGTENTIADMLRMEEKYDPNSDTYVEESGPEPERDEDFGSW